MEGKFPLQIDEEAAKEIWEPQKNQWSGMTGVVQVNPGRWVIQEAFRHMKDHYYNFKFGESDVPIMGVPKTGTTWLQEIVWTMTNNPNCKPMNLGVYFRTSTLEADIVQYSSNKPKVLNSQVLSSVQQGWVKEGLLDKITTEDETQDDILEGGIFPFFLRMTERQPGRRVFKTHCPFPFFPTDMLEKCKVVYIIRSPKDTVVSSFKFHSAFEAMQYSGTFDELFELFINDKLPWCPYWTHVKEAWERRNHPNLHIVFYEKLKDDTTNQLKKLDAFLGTNLTPKQLANVEEYIGFGEMKKREDSKPFSLHGMYRKGISGDWKNHLAKEQNDRMNEWIKTNSSGLNLPINYSG